MTRQEVLDAYDVNDSGIITSPGKFEGTPIYTPHFWELVLEGEGEEHYDHSAGTPVSIIHVDEWDLIEYPELATDHIKYIQMHEDDQGFIYIDGLDDPKNFGEKVA